MHLHVQFKVWVFFCDLLLRTTLINKELKWVYSPLVYRAIYIYWFVCPKFHAFVLPRFNFDGISLAIKMHLHSLKFKSVFCARTKLRRFPWNLFNLIAEKNFLRCLTKNTQLKQLIYLFSWLTSLYAFYEICIHASFNILVFFMLFFYLSDKT